MSFFAVLFALLLEQARPLGRGNLLHGAVRSWARWASRNLDAGRTLHGWLAWGVVAAGPALLSLAIHLILWHIHGALAFVWSVAVLYVTLGFRQFSHHFTAIRDALDVADEDGARELLADWQKVDASELPRSEIVRHVIEHSVLAAHRHVFGVFAWFSICAALGLGPAGAVLYRMSEFASRYWVAERGVQGDAVSPALQQAAQRAWGLLDFFPARMTAIGFAIVGSFEDAIDSWRNYTQSFSLGTAMLSPRRNDGVVLAATAGAVNVRLGGAALKPVRLPLSTAGEMVESVATGFTPGREPEPGHLRSVVGLVWRSVVLWMVLLALLTLARLLG
ncbi:MAG: CobD/CbiB family protein [Pseudomonadota bacterium]